MHIVSIVIQSWLLLWMTFQGVSKLAGAKQQIELFDGLRLPQRLRVLTGIVQLIGCAGLVAGYWYPGTAAWAGALFGVMMVVAAASHFRVKEPASKAAPAFVTLALSIAVFLLFVEELANPFA